MTRQTPSRSAERFRLARRSVALGTIEKGAASFTSLVRVPLLLWGLGLELYGLYVAILGIVATARLLDFGLHYGVLNAVADARGRDDEPAVRRTVSTAFFVYAALAVAGLVVLSPIAWVLPLDRLLSVDPELVGPARIVVLVALFALVLPLPLKVFSAALAGFQQQYLVAAFSTVSMLAQLGVLAVVVVAFPGRLLWVAGAVLVTEALHWCLFAAFALRRRPLLAVRPSLASRALVPGLVSAGIVFFFINLANLMKFTLGSPVVSHGLGTAAVPGFSVPLALFMTALGIADLVGASFWPAYAEAAARAEWSWVQRAFALGTKAAIGVAAGLAVLGLAFGDVVILVWTGGAIFPGRTLLALFAVWLVAQTCYTATAALLSGLHQQRALMWTAVVEGAATLGLAILVVEPYGIPGVVGVMAATSCLTAAFLMLVVLPRRTDGQVSVPWRPLAGVGLATAAALAVGWFAARGLAGAPVMVRLVAGAGLTAGVYIAAAWWWVLDGTDRLRLRGWVQSRIAGRGRPPLAS